MNPDEIDAARLQDARDDSDPGPEHPDLGGCYICGLGHDAAVHNSRHPITDAAPSWRDRYDTREEYNEGRL
jgi:hypothetical protein